jgi:hypothetical protein
MTLEAADRRWASFNLREDQFGDLRLGSAVRLMPAAGGDAIAARVTEMDPPRRVRDLARSSCGGRP